MTQPTDPNHTGKSFAKNAFSSLLAQLLPAVVGIAAVPFILSTLGTDRFGILSVAWLIIGYFSLFDLGLGKVLTTLVAEKIGQKRPQDIHLITKPLLVLIFVFSLVAGLILFLLSHTIVHRFFNIPQEFLKESTLAFQILAITVPLVSLTSGLRGVLEAMHLFTFTNWVQILMGLGNFLIPVFTCLFSPSLVPLVFGLLLLRILIFVILYIKNRQVLLQFPKGPSLPKDELKNALKFGGWLTVTNVLGPFVAYMDRFTLGTLLPISTLAYYTTPFDVVTRLWILPTAVTKVLTPSFAGINNTQPERLLSLFDLGLRSIFFGLLVPVFILSVFSTELMTLWLGTDFAVQSAPVAFWMVFGILINSVSWVPYVYLQAKGGAHLTAKLSIITTPLYFLLLFFMVKNFGIHGAVLSWFFNIVLSLFILFYYAGKYLPGVAPKFSLLLVELLILMLSSWFLVKVDSLALKLSITLFLLLAILLYGYRHRALPNEKQFLKKLLSNKLILSRGDHP